MMWKCTVALYFAAAYYAVCKAESEYIILATDEAKSLIYYAYVDTPEQDNIELTPLPMTIGGGLRGVEYDPVEKKVYWTQFSTIKIKRASMDGSNIEELHSGIKTPSLALDVLNRKMYNGGSREKFIRVRNMNFGDGKILSRTPVLQEPADIAIDQTNGYIYISDAGRNVIERMRTDTGEDREVVVSDENVNGIDLDLTGCHLYWTNRDGNEIRRSSLSGTGEKTIANSTSLPQLTDPVDVASLGGYLYVLSGSSDKLIRISKDGTNLELIGNDLFSAPKNIIVRKVTSESRSVAHFAFFKSSGTLDGSCQHQHASCTRCAMKCMRAVQCQAFRFDEYGCHLMPESNDEKNMQYTADQNITPCLH